jgi:hypothetical protein
MLNKITSILKLIKNLLIRRRDYKLSFYSKIIDKEKKIRVWYYNFKNWGFKEEQLMMVSGADTLCEKFSGGKERFTVEIKASSKPLSLPTDRWYNLVGDEFGKDMNFLEKMLCGRNYKHYEYNMELDKTDVEEMWICPVTLFVLGRYPNYIYIKKED